jgi:TRAP-type C4-dicarboxylate transport system substrate-binding protein
VLIGNATANDTQAAANEKLAELMTSYSNGRLKASARHGQSLGTNAQMLAALQAGSIVGMVLPAGFISATVPELSLFDLPFLLPGAPAKITAFAAQSKAALKMAEVAEQKGIHVIGFHGIGPQSFLTKFPVSKLADIQGKKFRVIPSPPRVGAYQDWGAVPRPMEFGEVYTALQQGTLDGMENPPDVIYKMKLLAEMIGTTRSRVSFFMNKFRKLGFIDYNGSIEVHSSLLNAVLHEQPEIKT